MARLLVSVRDAGEAQIALESGAHLIDVKEPSRGSLGAADPLQIAEVVRLVAGRRPASAALGELLDPVDRDARLAEQLPAGLSFAKLGLAGCANEPTWPARWRSALARLPGAIAPVAVAYADWSFARAPHPAEVLAVGSELGCRAVLIDTFGKQRGGLLDHLALGEIGDYVERARRARLVVVLAGSLTLAAMAVLAPLEPDYFAVRGAVCRPDRRGQVDGKLVAALVGWLEGDGEGQTSGKR